MYLNKFSELNRYYHEHFYRNSIALMLNSGLISLIGLIFWIIAAHMISSNDIGLATAAMSSATFIISFSKLGLDSGLIRFLPKLNNQNELYSSVIFVVLIITIVLSIVFISGLEIFSPPLLFLQKAPLMLVFLGLIVTSSICSLQNTAFTAIRRSDIMFIQNLLLCLRVPLLIVMAYLGVFGVIASNFIAFLFSFIFGAVILHNYGLSITSKIELRPLYEVFRFSIGNYSSNILSFIPVSLIPIMIINMVGPKENAYFYIAYSIAGLLLMIPQAFSTSLFVEGSHNLPLKENFVRSIKCIFLLLIPAVLLVFLFGDKLLMVFNKEYSTQSFELLRLLALSSLFTAISTIYTAILQVQKDIKTLNFISLISTVMIILFGFLGIYVYGLMGMGYAWLLSSIIIDIVILLMVINKFSKINKTLDTGSYSGLE